MLHLAGSDLDLHCLLIFDEKNARLVWVNALSSIKGSGQPAQGHRFTRAFATGILKVWL